MFAESDSYCALDVLPGRNKGLVVGWQALHKGNLEQIPALPQASCLVQSRQPVCFRFMAQMRYKSYVGKDTAIGMVEAYN